MSQQSIWIVDDDRAVRFVLGEALKQAHFSVREFEQAESAISALKTAQPDLLITDVRMPGMGGMQFLKSLREQNIDVPIVVMSAYTDIATTASAFRHGAVEYLPKPFDLDEAVSLCQRVLGEAQVSDAPEPLETTQALIGQSPVMRELFRNIGRLAQTHVSVLIVGETGSGKELVARALHRESPRSAKPFVAINTAAIPAELLESELFGHEAGAFTGANKRQIGRFEQASGGTLFLDEIGDMPAALQTRLLRVLAEGEFFRVGGRELIKVDVRVLAATHQNLNQLVREGRFREDLLHRLDVVRLKVPALRERRDDIEPLARVFIAEASAELGASAKRLSAAAFSSLQVLDWPGNVRQLKNFCWRLVALSSAEVISADSVRRHLHDEAPEAVAGQNWRQGLAHEVQQALQDRSRHGQIHADFKEQFDHAVLRAALDYSQDNRVQAADLLGLGRNTLTRKLGAKKKPKRASPKKPKASS